jgi:hypothetical protein
MANTFFPSIFKPYFDYILSYPIRNLSLLGSSLEHYKQSIDTFDGLEARSEIKEYIQYERTADRPAWVNKDILIYKLLDISLIFAKKILLFQVQWHSNRVHSTNNNQNSYKYSKIFKFE